MSFIMDLPPDVETRLQQEATRRGVPVTEIVGRLVAENLPPQAALSPLPAPKGIVKNLQMSVEEWEAQFNAWTASQAPILPAIDPESLRRCNMYEDRISKI